MYSYIERNTFGELYTVRCGSSIFFSGFGSGSGSAPRGSATLPVANKSLSAKGIANYALVVLLDWIDYNISLFRTIVTSVARGA